MTSLAFQIGDCGGLRIEIAGTRAILRHSGALWLEAERTMVVADLHFEKGSSYAARFGQMLPPYDTRETLDRLERELAGLTFRHEPLPGVQPGEVAGHLHPAAKVTSGRATVRRRCFVTDGARLVLPAFGAFTGGLNILDPAFAPLFGGPALAAALGPHRVHAVGWKSLRPD